MAAIATAFVADLRSRQGLFHDLSVAAIAGGLAGMLVGGIGGRIAMRISGAMSDPSMVGGAITDNGNVLGAITVQGTLGLIVFVGLLPGIAGALVYVAVRPWLRPLGRWGGLVFGLALLAALGPLVLESFNIDFRKFGSAQLNVLMFALLFPLFGVALAILVNVVGRRMAGVRLVGPWGALYVAGMALAALILALVVLSTAGAPLGAEPVDPRPFAIGYWLVAGGALRFLVGKRHWTLDARQLGVRDRVLSYAILAVPVVFGLPSTIFAASFLARI